MELKKVVLAPDSFKGTLSSKEICAILRARILAHFPVAEVISIPMADGGEGTVDCFLEAVPGIRVPVRAAGPFFEEMEVSYGLIDGGVTAVIEMAACAGLSLVEGRRNPLLTTTFGVGQLMTDALARGARKIILGLGGSCTTDGGCGCAAALGVRFYNTAGEIFVPTGGTLCDIAKIENPFRSDIDIIMMCDVDNPFYGLQGAAAIFAPQKGADADAVQQLDNGLRALAGRIQTDLGMDISALPGAGAAGGMGGGLTAFLGGRITSGIQAALDGVSFDQLAAGADLVLTGEGKLDAQSLHGKVVIGVAERSQALNAPVIAIVGDIGEGSEGVYERGVTAVVSTNRLAIPIDQARARSRKDLAAAAEDLMRLLKCN